MLEQLDIYMQKQANKQQQQNPHTLHKTWLKRNHRPKYKVENGKTPRREKLDDLGYDDDLLLFFFFDMTLNTWSLKEIFDKLDFIKIEIFCLAKDNVKRMRS